MCEQMLSLNAVSAGEKVFTAQGLRSLRLPGYGSQHSMRIVVFQCGRSTSSVFAARHAGRHAP